MSEPEDPKASPLISVSDVFGLGSLSKSVTAVVQSAIGRLYRPVAIRNEGNVLIELKSKEIIDTAKARARANSILLKAETNALEKVRALQDLTAIDRMEKQADIVTEGLRRVEIKDADGANVRSASAEWMDLFLDMAERIDDAEIKQIWGEIFAREVTEGQRRMSLHTLDTMRYLEARHARLFDAYARTFLVFGRCWRDGFDSTFGPSGGSLLGRSDSHNDFRALAEMGFVEILPGGTPTKGQASAMNFHRFGVRITPNNQTFNIQEVRPTMRGEELMRVVLDLSGEREDLSVGRFARDAGLSYQILDPDRQSMVLRRWFQYLHNEAFRIEVGVFAIGQSFLNCDYQLQWQDSGLALPESGTLPADLVLPPEIKGLLA